LLLKKREAINKIEQDSIKTTFHQGHKALTSVVLNKELAGHRLDKSLDETGYLNTVYIAVVYFENLERHDINFI
jgi:hypothetical protein